MTQKFDLKQVYTMDDLKKLQQAGATAEELRQAYQMMPRREEATKELAGLKENISLAKVKDLLEKGADVNARDKDGYTALMRACANGHTDTARLLIEKGADVKAKSEDGKTALMAACANGHTDTAQLLIEKGADVKAKSEYGDTALMWACVNGHADVAQLLIEKGADVKARNKGGYTALMLACKKGYADVEQLLEEVMAVQEERSAKAREIRQVDSDTNGKPVDHSLRRTLFGGQQKGQNAPLNPTVARRMRDKMK